MIDPPMPRSVVMIKLKCWIPGMIARATKPTMKPTMMDQIRCNMGLSWLGREGYHGANLESQPFSGLAKRQVRPTGGQDRHGGSAAPPDDVNQAPKAHYFCIEQGTARSTYCRWRFASSMARYSSRGGLKVSSTRVSSIVSTPWGTLLAR